MRAPVPGASARRAAAEKTPAASAEITAPAEPSLTDLDPLTVPGFEGRPAIAVLPFDNLSGDPEQEYFADGIAEDLITRLSAWREFPVIARNSSFTYKGKPVDVKQVSRELGVRYVVEGSVRKGGDRVRITAQLIDATTGAHVWAEHYDRELEDFFAIQDEITKRSLARWVQSLRRSEAGARGSTTASELYCVRFFMRGKYCYRKASKGTRGEQAEARSCFEKAIEINPNSPLAYAWLAWTHLGGSRIVRLPHETNTYRGAGAGSAKKRVARP